MGHYEVQLAPVKSSKKLIFFEKFLFCWAVLDKNKRHGDSSMPFGKQNIRLQIIRRSCVSYPDTWPTAPSCGAFPQDVACGYMPGH